MTEKFNLWGRPFTPDSALTGAFNARVADTIKRSLESFLQSLKFATEFGSPLGKARTDSRRSGREVNRSTAGKVIQQDGETIKP